MSSPTDPKRSQRVAWLILICALMAFVAFVGLESGQLPKRVATHFDASGEVNGWMTKPMHIRWSLAAGVGSPLFIVAAFGLIRAMDGTGLNMPNKDYWLAPERKAETFTFIQRQGIWLAVMTVGFHAALYELTIRANYRRPPYLPKLEIWGLGGVFVALSAIWIIVFLRRFRRPVQ